MKRSDVSYYSLWRKFNICFSKALVFLCRWVWNNEYGLYSLGFLAKTHQILALIAIRSCGDIIRWNNLQFLSGLRQKYLIILSIVDKMQLQTLKNLTRFSTYAAEQAFPIQNGGLSTIPKAISQAYTYRRLN